jgi:hypothetical protein
MKKNNNNNVKKRNNFNYKKACLFKKIAIEIHTVRPLVEIINALKKIKENYINLKKL